VSASLVTTFDDAEAQLPARREDSEDMRALAENIRQIERTGLITSGEVAGHMKECIQFRQQIKDALLDLKNDYVSLRRVVLVALLVLAGIEILGGHAMMQALLAKWGVSVSISH